MKTADQGLHTYSEFSGFCSAVQCSAVRGVLQQAARHTAVIMTSSDQLLVNLFWHIINCWPDEPGVT